MDLELPSPRDVRAAMASTSPDEQYDNPSGGSGYVGSSENGKSPLSMSLGFLKNLTEKKTTRMDGAPLKRRGPKPDSKPALTRRQELNRQAQRTHRERKEIYIKALEQEVLRLKENFSIISRDKESLAEENRQLKLLLAKHGIMWAGTDLMHGGYSSSGSMSGSYATGSQGFSPPPLTKHSLSPSPAGMQGQSTQQQAQNGVDYDQDGIDFVLTLERPCMDHMQFLVERAAEPEGEPCGHALMATCPPEPFPEIRPDIPFGHYNGTMTPGQKTWDLSKSDLANLLDLSKRLNLDGEITPVMAWSMILSHPRFLELRSDDIGRLLVVLKDKVRCYGFGAVLEEFEVRDALENIFLIKPEPGVEY